MIKKKQVPAVLYAYRLLTSEDAGWASACRRLHHRMQHEPIAYAGNIHHQKSRVVFFAVFKCMNRAMFTVKKRPIVFDMIKASRVRRPVLIAASTVFFG